MSEQQSYQPVSAGYLDGFNRVPRARMRRNITEAQRQSIARHEARVAAAAEFVSDLLSGAARSYYLAEVLRPSDPDVLRVIESNYPGLVRPAVLREGVRIGDDLLQESLSVSDFPLLMGDVIDRMLLARFNALPQVWRQYISVGGPLRDFRTIRMLTTDGGNEEWNEISDLEGLTYTNITESGYTLEPKLYGKAIRLSWRLMMNDNLDAFREIPEALAQGGRRTINKFATDLLFDSSGPDATLFTTGRGNRLSGNPALSVTSLGAAIAALMGQTDSTGEPIAVEGVRLVYGPGLEVTVRNILNTLTFDATTDAGAATGRTLRVNNWLTAGITPVMDPYIPQVVTGGNAATSWALVADPGVGRPIARIQFLQGFEQPALYQKTPNTQRVGGAVDPDVGDFQSMTSEFKGLVAFGGAVLEYRAGIASSGAGS